MDAHPWRMMVIAEHGREGGTNAPVMWRLNA